MCVRQFVCIYMYVRMCATVYTYVHVCVQPCVYACMYACMHVYVCMCMCSQSEAFRAYITEDLPDHLNRITERNMALTAKARSHAVCVCDVLYTRIVYIH